MMRPSPPTATATNAMDPRTAPTMTAVLVEGLLASAGLGGKTFGEMPAAY